jgi:hypothetical protein
MRPWWTLAIVLFALAACVGVTQRFPLDVQTALAREPMRRLETPRFIIYYAAARGAEVERFVVRADRCAELLRSDAVIRDGEWAEKMVILMPDVAYNNALVLPELAGYEEVAIIPLHSTADFATEFGLPPDPGFVACHELVHYVHHQQVAGFWRVANAAFGHIYEPQQGYDPWFAEGLATHYEAELSPGVGRPRWPIFTGMFAAAFAHARITGGDMSALARLAPMGNHYLVGSMFMRFLTETYGDRALWRAIAAQAHALTGWFFTSTFDVGFGKSFGRLLDEFDAWTHATFPARERGLAQRRLRILGNDARYARGRDGTEAWVADDVDLPPHLVVRDARGAVRADIALEDVIPPRTLVQAQPLLVSGLSITADGQEVWLTVIDQGPTFETPRTLRWRRTDGRVREVAHDLGPGLTIDPRGQTYYYAWVDGDAWSLAAYDTRTGARSIIVESLPGRYVLAAQASADGAHVVADVWNGHAFVAEVVDVATGVVLRELGGRPESPIWDASFTTDGRVMYLGEVAGRFQVFVDGVQVSDAPYAALGPREALGTIRFMDREGWYWELAELGLPPPIAATTGASPATITDADDAGRGLTETTPPSLTPASAIVSDRPFSKFDHLLFPQLRAPTVVVDSAETSPHVGFVFGGGDRLGIQRYSVAGFVQPPLGGVTRAHYGADVAYLCNAFAPVQLYADANFYDWGDRTAATSGTTTQTVADERRTRDAIVALSNTYRGTLVTSLGALYTDDSTTVPSLAYAHRTHAGGPQLALQWESAETTRYTAERRALIVDASAAFYPRATTTFTGDITDVGGTLGAFLPLPVGRRHRLYIDVRGRALLSPQETGLLQLGGLPSPAFYTAYARSSTGAPPQFDDSRFPPNLTFVEVLRGYEDYAITTDRAALADVAWRYPWIIDRGVAATARLLPASFLREVDLELFGAGAVDSAGATHAAAGGAVTLRLEALRIPLVLTYQLARRFADDRAITQLFGVGPDR